MKKYKVPFIIYMFFGLVYFNQGLADLPGQCIYYLTRETWGLSATMLGLIGFFTGIAWYIKPLFGLIADYFGSKGLSKFYLLFNTILIIIASLVVILIGFNFWTLLIILTLINCCIASNDVCNDKSMCILEKKHNLSGRIQAIQWISLGLAGLFVSVAGAYIANKLPEPYNYKVAYAIMILAPIALLIYLIKYYKPKTNKRKKIKIQWKEFKNKEFIIGIVFIMFLRFSPSFGKALMIQMRENMQIGKMFIGYLGATGTVLGIIGYVIYYWKAYKIDFKKLLYFSITFSALTNLCYLFIPNKWAILSYSVIFGAFDGVCFLTILAFVAKIVPLGNEGFFYAVITSVNNLSARLGGVVGGLVFDNYGYFANVILASVTTLTCLFFVPYLKYKKENEELSC